MRCRYAKCVLDDANLPSFMRTYTFAVVLAFELKHSLGITDQSVTSEKNPTTTNDNSFVPSTNPEKNQHNTHLFVGRIGSRGQPWIQKKQLSKIWSCSSWWLNHPCAKYACQIGSFPQFSGWKYKNIWNHHLVVVTWGILHHLKFVEQNP